MGQATLLSPSSLGLPAEPARLAVEAGSRRRQIRSGAVALIAGAGLLLASSPAAGQCDTQIELAPGDTEQGTLSLGDCTIAELGVDPGGNFPIDPASLVDQYTITLPNPGFLSVGLESSAFDAFLFVFDSELRILEAAGDDSGEGSTNALISSLSFEAGTYVILATGVFADETGAYTLTTSLDMSENPACLVRTAIPASAIAGGDLLPGDCTLAQLDIDRTDNSLVDQYEISVAAGPLSVRLESDDFDAFLWLYDLALTEPPIALDDDGGAEKPGETHALISLPDLDAGTYVILANALHEGETGAYTLTVLPEPSTAVMQLSAIVALLAVARSRARRRIAR